MQQLRSRPTSPIVRSAVLSPELQCNQLACMNVPSWEHAYSLLRRRTTSCLTPRFGTSQTYTPARPLLCRCRPPWPSSRVIETRDGPGGWTAASTLCSALHTLSQSHIQTHIHLDSYPITYTTPRSYPLIAQAGLSTSCLAESRKSVVTVT